MIGAVSGRLFLADVETATTASRAWSKLRGVKDIAASSGPTRRRFSWTRPCPTRPSSGSSFPRSRSSPTSTRPCRTSPSRQVLGAPVSARKLGIIKEANKPPRIEPPEGNRNLQAIRRAILHRHLEVERKPTLVIAQKSVAEWLKASGLPPGMSVEHFNNISGLDGYRDVRLLIAIGRTLPNVIEVEAYAGALTGLEPIKTEPPAKGPRWFDKTVRGIRLKDGTGYAVEADVHPDPTAEAVRWQICEGELVQAIGRARGVNRTRQLRSPST